MPLKDPEARREYQRGWEAKNADRIATQRRERYHFDPEYREKRKQQAYAWRAKSLSIRTSHKKLARAVASGRVDKPVLCQFCGTYAPLHGHHRDYSKPLDVQWLCAPCHGKEHRHE